MDFKLDGLSPRTFEHLVQALALREITSLVTPFGDGPDGGREATFEGPTKYGIPGHHWDGYGVMQAKFLAKPHSPTYDGKWAVRQLRAELAEYEKPDSQRKIPRYYIYATNVTLTATQDSGSKDTILALLADFAANHNLGGYDVWDYDKIRTLLINNESVRKFYAAWITPGDVLAEVLKSFGSGQRDYYRLVSRFLQKELRADQYARLEQAGHSSDEAIPLSRVFVDLPTAPDSIPAQLYEQVGDDHLKGFVSEIIDAASQHSASKSEDALSSDERRAGRYVLIGGPGQGKTTLGQFVCQIFRAALLTDVDPSKVAPEARGPLTALKKQWEYGDLPFPRARRLPFRIVLSEFADSLAKSEAKNVLEFLAHKIAKHTNVDLSYEEMERLLSEYPILLVLDGLDEVPPSTNRQEVLAAIADFWVDVAALDIDALVIATSRPQGYNEDFSPRQYQHRYLVPLSRARALHYGKKLAEVKFGNDAERLERICTRLEKAVEAPATARLMRTPLQVTILTMLVDRIGHPPEERWALFSQYYNLIYQREMERDLPSVKVLRENAPEVNAIHRRVGLVLQVESEKSGGTEARLTAVQFSKLVHDYLLEEGHQGEELQHLQASIIDAATNRLVFLVGLEEEQVGFEIRSLQEFMAAEGLMDGDDRQVQDRLKAVAPSANWRNVLLFAAGRIFKERQYLRDTVEAICFNMNEDPDDPILRLTKAGSELALDLLEDGPARRQPKKRGSLTRLALQLLDGNDRQTAQRLANVYMSSTESIYAEELSRRVRSAGNSSSQAWTTICHLIAQQDGPIRDLAHQLIDEQVSDAHVYRILTRNHVGDAWSAQRLLDELPHQGFWNGILAGNRIADDDDRFYGPWNLEDAPTWLAWLAHCKRQIRPSISTRFHTRIVHQGELVATVGIGRFLKGAHESPMVPTSDLPVLSPSWDWIKRAGDFCRTPNVALLGQLIRELANLDVRNNIRQSISACYPWPLAECADAVWAGADPMRLASSIEGGEYGAPDSWIKAESRWREQGMELDEIRGAEPLYVEGGKPYLFTVPLRGITVPPNRNRVNIDALVSAYNRAQSIEIREALARLIILSALESQPFQDSECFDRVLYDYCVSERETHRLRWYRLVLEFGHSLDLSDSKWSSLFQSQWKVLLQSHMHNSLTVSVDAFEEFFLRKPEDEGLLIPLAAAALSKRTRYRMDRPLFSMNTEDSVAVRAAKVILVVASGVSVTQVESQLEPLLKRFPGLGLQIATAISYSSSSYEQERDEIVALTSLMSARSSLFESKLRALAYKRRSVMEHEETWRDLGLPSDLLRLLD